MTGVEAAQRVRAGAGTPDAAAAATRDACGRSLEFPGIPAAAASRARALPMK